MLDENEILYFDFVMLFECRYSYFPPSKKCQQNMDNISFLEMIESKETVRGQHFPGKCEEQDIYIYGFYFKK